MSFLSRSEEILTSKINDNDYDKPAQSRLEALLLKLNTSSGTDTKELTREVDALKDDVSSAQNSITFLNSAMTKNANSIAGLQTSVAGAQNKIANNQQTIQVVGEAVQGNQVEIGVLQKGLSELNQNIRDIQEDVIRIEDHAIIDSNGDGDDD